jgi:signal transduction histidine kinase
VLATAALQEQRQRLARDVHDGVAQDLAFIVQSGRRLAREPGATDGLRALVVAAEHALDESRHAVATLARAGDESLTEAVASTAAETAGREGGRVELRLGADVVVPAATQEALLRVLREAIINARRHGSAETIVVELSGQPRLRMTVTDDGAGFDVGSSSERPGHFGLKSMDARVRAIGGKLTIDSQAGQGTRLEVVIP